MSVMMQMRCSILLEHVVQLHEVCDVIVQIGEQGAHFGLRRSTGRCRVVVVPMELIERIRQRLSVVMRVTAMTTTMPSERAEVEVIEGPPGMRMRMGRRSAVLYGIRRRDWRGRRVASI